MTGNVGSRVFAVGEEVLTEISAKFTAERIPLGATAGSLAVRTRSERVDVGARLLRGSGLAEALASKTTLLVRNGWSRYMSGVGATLG